MSLIPENDLQRLAAAGRVLVAAVRAYDREVMRVVPWAPWTTPVPVVSESVRGWACRLCITRENAEVVSRVWLTEAEVAEHLRELHDLDL
jgi:hypothetical protein